MRKTFSTLALVLALGATVLAGDIPSPPAPSPAQMSDSTLAAEEIINPLSSTQSPDEQFADGLAEAALNVLNSVLALF